MQTVGQAIYKLRTSKKLSRDALGQKIGVSKTAVKNWEDGENSPKLEYLQGLANYFGCSVEGLSKGEIDDQEVSEINSKEYRQAPVLNFTQAGHFKNYFDDAIPDTHEPVPIDSDPHVYWVKLGGLSMAPDFKPDELVLINPDIQPNPGDYVLALKHGEKATTFKKWRPRGFDENGKEYYELVPSNPDFPIIDSRHTPFDICGVAIEHKKKLR